MRLFSNSNSLMKLSALVGQEKHEVEVERKGEEIHAKVDGREYELLISEPESNVFLIKHGVKVFQFVVSPNEKTGEPLTVTSRHGEFEVTLIDPKSLRGSAAGSSAEHGLAEIRTAMPGKIVRILLEVGSEVSKGDVVLVVEAMKMQNDLKAPRSGTLKEIRVKEGDTVAAGDVLAVVE